jgi:hypothetical protein
MALTRIDPGGRLGFAFLKEFVAVMVFSLERLRMI